MTDLSQEIDAANARLPVDLSLTQLPLDMTVRAIAVTIAQRHCGDATCKEGNLYQHLKMDGKLTGPLTVEHVIQVALAIERYLWGEFSKGIAGEAMEKTMAELEERLSGTEE